MTRSGRSESTAARSDRSVQANVPARAVIREERPLSIHAGLSDRAVMSRERLA
jgi:hypothetical protein